MSKTYVAISPSGDELIYISGKSIKDVERILRKNLPPILKKIDYSLKLCQDFAVYSAEDKLLKIIPCLSEDSAIKLVKDGYVGFNPAYAKLWE